MPCDVSPYIIIEQIIFSGPFGSLFELFNKIRVLLKPMLGGVSSVAYIITVHKQTQYSRVCFFSIYSVYFLLQKVELLRTFIFIEASVVP